MMGVKMPGIKMSIAHSQPAEEALKRIKAGIDEMKTRFADKISDLQEDWNGNTCKFSLLVRGFSGSGTMIVKPSDIEISGDLPFPAIFFKDKIESAIREKMNQWLG
jgi:hypothetical protein